MNLSEDLLRVRAVVHAHKAQRPPPATNCRYCGYKGAGAFTVCPICKRAVEPAGRDAHQLEHPQP